MSLGHVDEEIMPAIEDNYAAKDYVAEDNQR